MFLQPFHSDTSSVTFAALILAASMSSSTTRAKGVVERAKSKQRQAEQEPPKKKPRKEGRANSIVAEECGKATSMLPPISYLGAFEVDAEPDPSAVSG
jgi:hypothetical protein